MEEPKKIRKPDPPRSVMNEGEPILTCEERRRLYALHPQMCDEVQYSPAYLEKLDEEAIDALLNKEEEKND